jgi:hypothetical protein
MLVRVLTRVGAGAGGVDTCWCWCCQVLSGAVNVLSGHMLVLALEVLTRVGARGDTCWCAT